MPRQNVPFFPKINIMDLFINSDKTLTNPIKNLGTKEIKGSTFFVVKGESSKKKKFYAYFLYFSACFFADIDSIFSIALFMAISWLSPPKLKVPGRLFAPSRGIEPPPHIGSQMMSPVEKKTLLGLHRNCRFSFFSKKV